MWAENICWIRGKEFFFLVIYISNKRRKVIKIPNGHCYDLRYHQLSVENIFHPALFRNRVFSFLKALFWPYLPCFLSHVYLSCKTNSIMK